MAIPLQAEQVNMEAARLPIHEIAQFLQIHLGKQLTAYISGVKEPKMVTHWIAQRNTPRDQPQLRLREGYQAARLLVSAFGDETAKAWFSSSNAKLEDRSPAFVLRNAATWEELRSIVPTARTFASGV